MIELLVNLISACLLAAGSIFVLIGAFGLVRLPDFYTRLHAAGITDTLGAELILIGLMFQAGFSLVTVKLILISLFIFFTSPKDFPKILTSSLKNSFKGSTSFKFIFFGKPPTLW